MWYRLALFRAPAEHPDGHLNDYAAGNSFLEDGFAPSVLYFLSPTCSGRCGRAGMWASNDFHPRLDFQQMENGQRLQMTESLFWGKDSSSYWLFLLRINPWRSFFFSLIVSLIWNLCHMWDRDFNNGTVLIANHKLYWFVFFCFFLTNFKHY